jgi:hypothetical protein
MRFLWLSAVAVGLIGVVLYLVAQYDYSQWWKQDIDWRLVPSGTGLRGWVRFYHEHRLLLFAAPLAAIGFGIGGFLVTLVSGKLRRQRVGQVPLSRGLHIPLRIPPVVRRNSIATVAITLSVINFGILVWQVWPEGSYTPPKSSPWFGYSAPSGDFRDVTEERFRRLERELNGVQGIGGEIDRLRDCISSLRSDGDRFYLRNC